MRDENDKDVSFDDEIDSRREYSSVQEDMESRIQDLEELNSLLISKLERKEKEVAQLHAQIEDFDVIVASQTSSGTTSSVGGVKEAKLLDLAKKNRALTLALEKEKTKSAKLKSQLDTLEMEKLDEHAPGSSSVASSLPDGNVHELYENDIEDLQTRLRKAQDSANKANSRLQEMRVANQSMKSDIQRLKQALQREVGEDIPIQQILEDGSKWKGRAQKITLLKAQIRELRGQLVQYSSAASSSGMDTDSNIANSETLTVSSFPSCALTTTSGMTSLSSPSKDFDSRHMQHIQHLESQKKLEVEELSMELGETREASKSLKSKVDALQARIKVLESGNRDLKAKIKTLLEKSETDDELVDALKKEVEKLRSRARSSAPRVGGARDGNSNIPLPSTSSSSSSSQSSQSDAELVARLRRKITEKDAEIHRLQGRLDDWTTNNTGSALKSENQDPRILQVEIDRLNELVENLHVQIRDLEMEMLSLREKSFPLESFAMMQDNDRIALLVDENRSLKATLRSTIAKKDGELNTYKQLIEDQKSVYDSRMRDLCSASGSRISSSASSTSVSSLTQSSTPSNTPGQPSSVAESAIQRDRIVAELTAANAGLRGEIETLRHTLAKMKRGT